MEYCTPPEKKKIEEDGRERKRGRGREGERKVIRDYSNTPRVTVEARSEREKGEQK